MPLNRPALDLLRASARVGRDLQQEIEQFLFYEGSLLDDHQLEEWLGLLADDIRYFMPIRRTLANRDRAKEFSGKTGRRLPHTALSCRYFVGNPDPPAEKIVPTRDNEHLWRLRSKPEGV